MSPTRESLEAYGSALDRYDELLDDDGAVREHWRPLIDRLLTDGPDAARRGVELARRLIVENGVTYNVYADPQGRDRPWALDPLPFLIPAPEWRRIEAGVQQRAQLLNALLADLYGPQELLAQGVIPPELPFGHPNFLWPCRGLKPADGTWLHVYAVDLARAPDGRWWVLGDRAQTPSGPGYALENRQIVSRVYPELAKTMGASPIGGFFAGLRERLLAPAEGSETPLAVVLTPGPFNETYFEHAYLARHLGLPLVEGHDLTVRGANVYLKTLSGLKRVHSILRRLDDDFCDPVELRADSALGVPGLLGAVRAGRVVVANALGTGVLESPAWLGFMPGVAKAMLGEKLLLPSVATWWCGEEPALEDVIENLDRLVIKATFPNQRFEPVFGKDLSDKDRVQLLERLRLRPHAYVAQERVAFSQAPVWRGSGAPALGARALGIRVYAIATEGGYSIMPGGMARIESDLAVDIVSTQRGGGSKDIWVLTGSATANADDPHGDEQLARMPVRHDELPSGLVENLFWLGRYAERSENKTRLLRATFAVRADPRLWETALDACHRIGVLSEEKEPSESLFDREEELGLAADLGRLAWCATRSRSRLSAEHWRSLNTLQRQFHEADAAKADPRETLDRLLLGLAALAGFTLDDMTQDDGWRLMMLGRELERLQFVSALLANSLQDGAAPYRGELEWLLDVGGSTITYRTRYLASPRLVPTLQLLVFDDGNPRALAFHWRGVRRTLVQLAASLGGAVEDVMEDAIHRLAAAGSGPMDAGDEKGVAARAEFCAALQGLNAAANRLCNRLGMRHFSHTELDPARGGAVSPRDDETPYRYRVRHLTRYAYDREVMHSHQLLRLMPRAMPHQTTLGAALTIAPQPAVRVDGEDAFGNPVTRIQLDRPHDSLVVEAMMEVEVRLRPPRKAGDSQPWRELAASLRYTALPLSPEELEVRRYLSESPYVRVKRTFSEFAASCFSADAPVLTCAERLMHKIHGEFTYAPGETQVLTPLLDVLDAKRGVCQDYAHVMIACLRAQGLAARYVSGYLRTLPRGEKAAEPELVGADASHAWVAVYAPPFGWVALDPTNDLRVGRDHVTLAWGRDFGDVSPLRGVILGGGEHELSVNVSVRPLR